MTARPRPPVELLDPTNVRPLFVSANDLAGWATVTFLDPDSKLYNPDHAHLAHATIGALWTNVPNSRGMHQILATAQLGQPGGNGAWAKGRSEMQLLGWFGEVPDFLLTFYAPYAAECGDAEFCALVEHELYHCAQARTAFGAPRFTQTGAPIFAIRGHDVEEFVGVVRRYGADAAGVRRLVDAASRPAEIAAVNIAQACGTCMLRAA